MFATTKPFSSFSVDDLEAAKRFYGETLGLKLSDDLGVLMLHLAPGQDLLIYPKERHTPATFTVLNFPVEDVEQAVDELTSRGVTIERYEGYDTDDRGIYHSDGHLIAWFTDPAGNGLSVVQEI